jgi:N6-adenosine-specific RNA methylase IME4
MMARAYNPIPYGQFNVIYVDPPWAHEAYSEKGYEKSQEKHYDTMSDAQLEAMLEDILFSCGPNCVLFMWATFPKLPSAVKLMDTWGFEYKTGGAWHKRSKTFVKGCEKPKSAFGTGYIFRSAAELFLVGTTGTPKIKNHSTRNIIEAAVREHSQKPECTYELIESLWEGPYLELFARNSRKGWVSWGNESTKYDDKALGVAV